MSASAKPSPLFLHAFEPGAIPAAGKLLRKNRREDACAAPINVFVHVAKIRSDAF
jgi:hypothetical protein